MVWRWVISREAVALTLASQSRNVASVPEQVGLVLLVVGDERAHGLVVEALELGRVAHVRQQQLVGPGLLVGELGALGVALDDVEREQRLVVGALEVQRVLDPAAAPQRGRRSRPARPRARAARPTTRGGRSRRPDPGSAARPRRGRPRSARRSTRRRWSGRPARRRRAGAGASPPRSASAHGRGRRRRWPRPTGRCRAPCRGRCRSSRSAICRASTARWKLVAASSEARSGARTRSTSEAISVVTSRSSAPSGVCSRPRIRSWPTGGLGDPQLDRGDVLAAAHERALVGRASGRRPRAPWPSGR